MYLSAPIIQIPIPLYRTNLLPLGNGVKCQVFLDEETQFVYKYFTRSFERPNRDLLTAVSAYEEVDVDEVAETLSVLKYVTSI